MLPGRFSSSSQSWVNVVVARRNVSVIIPVVMITIIILLTQSPLFGKNPFPVSVGIIFDLLVTVPIVHYLLVPPAKRSLITLVPFLVAGLLIGSAIVPAEHQQPLKFFKMWIFPLIEVAVIVWIVVRVRGALQKHRRTAGEVNDFFNVLKSVCTSIFPGPLAVFMASEIAVVYYGFFLWKPRVSPHNEFTYHRSTSTPVLLGTLIFLVFAETAILHLLLVRWSVLWAWVLTGLSLYTGIQLLGFIKSIVLRPIIVANNQLHLRYGILREVAINRHEIVSVELIHRDPSESEAVSLSTFARFEGCNVLLRLREQRILHGVYGFNRKFTALTFFVDDKERFLEQLTTMLKTSSSES